MSYFDDNNFGYETSERYLGGSDYQPLSQGSYFKPSPSPEWNASQLGYEGSTLLDGVGCQFIDPHALQRDCTYNYNHGVNADGSYRHTHSYPSSSGSESWPTSEYGQPMAGPSSVEGDGWPRTQTHGETPAPQTVPGVPRNTDLPFPIAPSHGPQRSRGTKGKGKATQRRKGKWNRSAEPLPRGVGSSWEETKDRFVWEMLEIYHFRPAGGLINPEEAFAACSRFIEEDLHRSPLAASENRKECRLVEQYLAHVLMELQRSKDGETQNETMMYTQVLDEIVSELVPMHTGPVLKEGHPWKGELDGEDNPRRAAHREIERTRRATIRRLQGEMSRYFVVPQGKKLSVWELLLFVVIYLRIGRHAFPGFVLSPADISWMQ